MVQNNRYTEKELFNVHKQNLYIMDKLIYTGYISFSDVLNYMPGNIHFNNNEDLSIKYLSTNFQKSLGISIEEVELEGVHFLQRLIHPNTTKNVVPIIKRFIKRGDTHQVLNFFQYSRTNLSKVS